MLNFDVKKIIWGANYIENPGAGWFSELSWINERGLDPSMMLEPITRYRKKEEEAICGWGQLLERCDVSRQYPLQLREDASGLKGSFGGASQQLV